jgi:hypothetical protein
MATVSRIHPRTILRVAHVASPFNIFLMDAGSCRCTLSWSLNFRNTSSKELSKMRLTFRRCAGLPFTMPTKSSTSTSQDWQRKRLRPRGHAWYCNLGLDGCFRHHIEAMGGGTWLFRVKIVVGQVLDCVSDYSEQRRGLLPSHR